MCSITQYIYTGITQLDGLIKMNRSRYSQHCSHKTEYK
jgi:hypothetical protein